MVVEDNSLRSINREFNPDNLRQTMDEFKNKTVGFEAEEWLSDDKNIALTDGKGNYNLLEYDSPGVYYAHTFYKDRGKTAVRLIQEMVRHIFDNYPVEVMKGLAPLTHLGARWITRKAGLKSHGVVHTVIGPCELFILTRKEYQE